MALVTPKFATDANDVLDTHGELHVVTDVKEVMEEACGVLTASRRFMPCFAFPFFEACVPGTYPLSDLICSDAKETDQHVAIAKYYYTRWEKKEPDLPNFRFKRGRGYASAAVPQEAFDVFVSRPPHRHPNANSRLWKPQWMVRAERKKRSAAKD